MFLRTGEWGPFKIGLDSDSVLKLAGDKILEPKLSKNRHGCWLYGEIEFGISDRKLGYIQIDFHRFTESDGLPFNCTTRLFGLKHYLAEKSIPFIEAEPKDDPGNENFKIGTGVYAHFKDGELFNLIVTKSSLEEIVPGRRLIPEFVNAGGPNTLKNRIERLALKSNDLIVLDVKNAISREQALQQIRRAEGKVGSLKDRVIILTSEGILRHE